MYEKRLDHCISIRTQLGTDVEGSARPRVFVKCVGNVHEGHDRHFHPHVSMVSMVGINTRAFPASGRQERAGVVR